MRNRNLTMKRVLICASLLALSMTPLLAADFSFTPADVVGGVSWTETGTYHSDLNIVLNDSARELPPVTRTLDVTRSKSVTVVQAGGNDVINVLDVSYTAAPVATVVNNTYRLTVKGNHADIAYADPTKGTPTDAEIAFVDGDNTQFGQLRALNRIFGKKSFTTDQAAKVNKNDAEELINVGPDLDVSDLTLTLRSVNGDVASFDISLTLQSNIKKGSPDQVDSPFSTGGMTIALAGTLQLKTTTCRPTSIVLNGTTTLTGSKPTPGHSKNHDATLTVNGTGTTNFSFTYAF
jgi:hypothetical protein